jgi:sterol desaturase/sphingolipid hydroxylase (fatty acid hydroxylase superfamily)
MTSAQVIVLATPVFLLLIAAEWLFGWRRGRQTYRWADALSSIGLGMLSQVVGVFSLAFTAGIYLLVFDRLALTRLPVDSPAVWFSALLIYDLCYYWHHRLGHRCALFWAAHVVHHQSEDYNLSTALRQTGSGWLFGWVFYLPMALLGFPPLVFGTVALIDLLYQFWVHTRQIGKLGWFDRWFCSPSNHRVHHAVNDRYLDRNYGGILMVWDRMFGSFVEEDDLEPIVYGTRKPLRSWNPITANLEVYAALARDSWRAASWGDKLRVWFKPPGWRPSDVAARWPQPAFELARVRRFDPLASPAAMAAAGLLFVAALGLTAWFLWNSHRLPPMQLFGSAALVLAAMWAVGVLSGRDAEPTARTDRRPTAAAAAGPGADRPPA